MKRAAGKILVLLWLLASLPTVQVYASEKEVETVWLGSPAHVWWETDTVGAWSSVKKAHEYQVKLYLSDDVERDEDDLNSIDVDALGLEAAAVFRVTENRCDFTQHMSDLHTYFFTVQATPRLKEQAYVMAGSKAASPDTKFQGKQVLGITDGTWRNYLEGSRYELADGTYLSNGWQLIRGSWYYLDEQGYRVTGWQEMEDCRYYFDDYGKMQKGWISLEDNWYYANSDGVIQTGWIMEKPGCYYYLNEAGIMLRDCEIDGYWLNSDGLCTTYTP